MCLFQNGEPYGLVLPRVILGSLGPSHTPKSVFPHHHCTMRSIGVESFSQKDINENIHGSSSILDPSTDKETRWDFLVLDTFIFRAFKGPINSKCHISFHFVCESKQPFEITDRTHHPSCLHRQPTMN
jgi:hypothetical protein